jgi:predicted RND superfamily exporter protein
MAKLISISLVSGFIEALLSRPRRVLGILFACTLFFLYCFFQQSHNNHISVFFEPDAPRYSAYQEFQAIFGNEEFVVVALADEDLFSADSLEAIRRLSEALERIEGVERVVSLTHVEEFQGSRDAILLRPVVPPGSLTPAKAARARERALGNRYVNRHLLADDARMTAVHVELASMGEDRKRHAAEEILRVSEEAAADAFRVYCSGPPFVEVEMNRLSEKDFKTFIPVILAIIFALIFLFLRHPGLSILCEINLLVILVWGVGLYVFCGEAFNIITSTMGAILLAIAIADSIHILSHLKDTLRRRPTDAITGLRQTIRQVWFPCLFTSLTTGAGFLSFATSDIPPVAVLGVFTAVGVMLAFILSMTTLPPLIRLAGSSFLRSISAGHARPERQQANDLLFQVLRALGLFVVRHRVLLLVFFAGILALAVLGMTRLRFETNTFNYLPDENPIKADFKVIEENFGGTIPFVVWIRAEGERDFKDPQVLRRLAGLQQRLLSESEVLTHAFSIVNYLKAFNRAINGGDPAYERIPRSRLDIADAYELGDPAVLSRVLSLDHRDVAITFLSTWKSNEAGYRLHERARRLLEEGFGEEFSFTLTGLSSLYLSMDKNLREGQKRSFITAFGIIFGVMLFVCRGFWLAVFSMVPNLFPIVLTLGLMGWAGISLDVATTMIASVTIGIAVDDSIHFVTWIRRNRTAGSDLGRAVAATFTDVGKPIVITTLLLFAGFFVMILGSILPTQMFGMLTAFSMVFALVGDMFVLPPLILIFKPRVPPLPLHSPGQDGEQLPEGGGFSA